MIDEEMEELFGSNEEIDLVLSFSRVSDFSRNGPKALLLRTQVNNDGAKIGSITDDWLFDRDNFEKNYFIYEGDKPTATLGKLVDIILKNYTSLPNVEEVRKIIKTNGFWKRSKPDTVENAFNIPAFWNYLKAQFKAKTTTLVTNSELTLGQDLALVLESHKHSKDLFYNDCEKISQYKFKIIYNNVNFRGIIDMVLIDHKKKTIRFIDLKTGQEESANFMNSYIKYRYYFQAAVYTAAYGTICEELGLKGYTHLPFQFLYIGRKEQIPVVLTVTKKWHDAAIKGFVTTSGYKYLGLDETILDIVWHYHNKVFNLSRKVFEGNGSVELDDSFFKLIK